MFKQLWIRFVSWERKLHRAFPIYLFCQHYGMDRSGTGPDPVQALGSESKILAWTCGPRPKLRTGPDLAFNICPFSPTYVRVLTVTVFSANLLAEKLEAKYVLDTCLVVKL